MATGSAVNLRAATKAQQAVALEVFGSFLSRKGNRFAGRTRAGTTAYRKPTPTEGQQREVPVKQCQRIEKSRPGTPQVRVIIRPRGRFHIQRFSIAMRPATCAQCCGGHRRDGPRKKRHGSQSRGEEMTPEH